MYHFIYERHFIISSSYTKSFVYFRIIGKICVIKIIYNIKVL